MAKEVKKVAFLTAGGLAPCLSSSIGFLIDEYTKKLLCLPAGLPDTRIPGLVDELQNRFGQCISDDLNVSGAVGALFAFIKETNPLIQARMVDAAQKKAISAALERIDQVLGVFDMRQCPMSPEIDRLFRPSVYLVSPNATPERFIQGEYVNVS